jgi:hypothetical protein
MIVVPYTACAMCVALQCNSVIIRNCIIIVCCQSYSDAYIMNTGMGIENEQ